MAGLVSSLRIKQSSLLIIFSPMHVASINKLAVDLGSNPYSKNGKKNSQMLLLTVSSNFFKFFRLFEESDLQCSYDMCQTQIL